jgi:transcriptional antiterminator NusG
LSDNKKWYAIHVFAGSEMAVEFAISHFKNEDEMKQRIFDVVVPIEELIDSKNNKERITKKSLYPGYVFAQLDLNTMLWQRIQSLPKVSKFIGEGKIPTPLSEKDVEVMLSKHKEKRTPRPKVSFEVGEVVRIKEGSFADFNGVVEEYDLAHGKLKLNVSIFSRNTPIEILHNQVEKIL